MLTRAQVARKLGRSIATVRRLEGSVLHPVRDAQGVYCFDAGEVERVARERRLLMGQGKAQSYVGDDGGRVAARSDWFNENGFAEDDDGDYHDGRGDDDEGEPEALSGQRDSGGDRETAAVTATDVAALSARVQELEGELAAERSAREKERTDAAERQVVAQDLVCEVEALLERELRQLDPETLGQIEILLVEGV